MKKYFLLAIIALCLSHLFAQTKDFEWELIAEGSEVFITKYTGTDTKVKIPANIDKKPVTAITGFANNKKIISVTIPEGVIYIRREKESLYLGAFTNCSALESVTLPKSLKRIDEYAFSKCTSLEKIDLGENLDSLGSHIFADCTALKEISLSQNIKKIPWAAFIRCTALENVTLSKSTSEIAYMAFQNCSALKSIELPETLRHIGPEAFKNCLSLEEVILLSEEINFHDYGKGIFTGCSALSTEMRKTLNENGYQGSFD
ncbi:MAG: hypothetical protein Ta2G_11930 [Termitinemataceae bacterium]|nr:MAG: hypothetical protein Ta2G_11930 [Termitinemataceae bacterium]